jgi:hypothetical protein
MVINPIKDNGELFTCGDNRYGKLGLNQKTYNSIQFTPVLVQKFRQLTIDAVINITLNNKSFYFFKIFYQRYHVEDVI